MTLFAMLNQLCERYAKSNKKQEFQDMISWTTAKGLLTTIEGRVLQNNWNNYVKENKENTREE